MKFSEAMLKTYSRGLRQIKRHYTDDAAGNFTMKPSEAVACCVMGAALLGAESEHHFWAPEAGWRRDFLEQWGIDPAQLNNNEGADEPFPWEHIYGMAVAVGQ